MRIGIAIEETWSFLHEIYEDLTTHHQVSLFQRRTVNSPVMHERINRRLFQHDLAKFMRDNDVVFFEWASALLAAATHMPKQCRIVTRLHRYEMNEWVYRINWDNVDKIILVSEAKRREFAEKFPAYVDKVEVVYEAVDPEKFSFQPRPFTGDIGILCHLTPRKRVYELILAFSEIISLGHSLHLHIGGGPHVKYRDYFDAMQDLVQKLQLQDSVTFHGHIEEPSDWYKNIDIIISNGYSEGLQVSPLEAMASGCFCLSHRWAGSEEMLPEKYLYYTDSQLQEKILTYCRLTETEKRQEREKLRSLIDRKFNVHKTKQEIRQIIERTLSA